MASFFSRLFGGGGSDAAEAGPAKRGDPVTYEGYVIQAAPEKAGGQWRLAGVIIKDGEGGALERNYTRADTFPTHDDAETFSIRKGKQIIDERGDRLFADGEATGRA